jgi:hypothetical protein
VRALSPLVLFASLTFSAVASVPACADIDLSGHWYAPQSATGFATITQSGADATIAWTEGTEPIVLSGTFDQTRLRVGDGSRAMFASLHGENVLIGTLLLETFTSSRFFSRCECFDGNRDNGDGCDSECRVEECYSCTGDPSTCVPSPDGAPCNDRSDCTSGETCAAGVCGAGTPEGACIDMSGLWRVTEMGSWPEPSEPYEVRFFQENGLLLYYQIPFPVPLGYGSIDDTGALELFANDRRDCSGWAFDGVTTDRSTFVGSFAHRRLYGSPEGPRACDEAASVIESTGQRCDPVNGCSVTDCAGRIDGTACVDTDPCTHRESCQAGACIGLDPCPYCGYCEDGLCHRGPDPGCSGVERSVLSMVQPPDRAERNQVKLKLHGGEAVGLADLGDPSKLNGVRLCVYDERGTTPNELYIQEFSPVSTCDAPPCWRQKGDSWLFEGRPRWTRPILADLRLKSGEAGRSSASLRLDGAGVFINGQFEPPLGVPLRVQLQVDTGACFEARFEESGVKTNGGDRRFRAIGTPP